MHKLLVGECLAVSEKRPLTKMLCSVSIKTRTFASVNTCNGSFYSCLKLLKQYRTIEQMCSDADSIILRIINKCYTFQLRKGVGHFCKKRITLCNGNSLIWESHTVMFNK